MASHSSQSPNAPEGSRNDDGYRSVDYLWFATRFEELTEKLATLESVVANIEQTLSDAAQANADPEPPREYYSVPEFAVLTSRSEYTVREWCRLERIEAEKCETGRGEAKNWKIPVGELQRYRDHGLMPLAYLR